MFNQTFPVKDYNIFKAQLLIWSSRFSSCAFLDNHQYESRWQQQECLVAAGSRSSFKAGDFTQLDACLQAHQGEWIFGHLAYDLKDEIEGLPSTPAHPIGFANLHFFVPETLVILSSDSARITCSKDETAVIFQAISSEVLPQAKLPAVEVESVISKAEYVAAVQAIREHIHRGDCYELNFCQEFVGRVTDLDTVSLYTQLTSLSPNPFCCYYRVNDSYLLCASPERFLMKQEDKLYSQPIKGTAARFKGDVTMDNAARDGLKQNPKELRENVMVVDLVRNDLSRICKEGTVKVDELFGVYTYPHVHQLISTISGELRPNTSFSDIVRATFPMGSMTGAPKKRVMELIAEYEASDRGLYSGAVGYIDPVGNFDFNVVIRSIQYNAVSGLLSYWLGGGITWLSDPEKEYEESLLKGMAIKKVLQGSTSYKNL